MNADSTRLQPRNHPRIDVIWRFGVMLAVASMISGLLLVTSARAAPKQIVFSGELRGVSIDVGPGVTGATFNTTGGSFTATDGDLKSGTYSSRFTLGAFTLLGPPTRAWFAVTGTFTLKTNGGSFTAAVIPASSEVSVGPTPSSSIDRGFRLQLQVVEGTGRFKKMTGTVTITMGASPCGYPPHPGPPDLCPDVPWGADPMLDWFTLSGLVTGTLTRES